MGIAVAVGPGGLGDPNRRLLRALREQLVDDLAAFVVPLLEEVKIGTQQLHFGIVFEFGNRRDRAVDGDFHRVPLPLRFGLAEHHEHPELGDPEPKSGGCVGEFLVGPQRVLRSAQRRVGFGLTELSRNPKRIESVIGDRPRESFEPAVGFANLLVAAAEHEVGRTRELGIVDGVDADDVERPGRFQPLFLHHQQPAVLVSDAVGGILELIELGERRFRPGLVDDPDLLVDEAQQNFDIVGDRDQAGFQSFEGGGEIALLGFQPRPAEIDRRRCRVQFAAAVEFRADLGELAWNPGEIGFDLICGSSRPSEALDIRVRELGGEQDHVEFFGPEFAGLEQGLVGQLLLAVLSTVVGPDQVRAEIVGVDFARAFVIDHRRHDFVGVVGVGEVFPQHQRMADVGVEQIGLVLVGLRVLFGGGFEIPLEEQACGVLVFEDPIVGILGHQNVEMAFGLGHHADLREGEVDDEAAEVIAGRIAAEHIFEDDEGFPQLVRRLGQAGHEPCDSLAFVDRIRPRDEVPLEVPEFRQSIFRFPGGILRFAGRIFASPGRVGLAQEGTRLLADLPAMCEVECHKAEKQSSRNAEEKPPTDGNTHGVNRGERG